MNSGSDASERHFVAHVAVPSQKQVEHLLQFYNAFRRKHTHCTRCIDCEAYCFHFRLRRYSWREEKQNCCASIVLMSNSLPKLRLVAFSGPTKLMNSLQYCTGLMSTFILIEFQPYWIELSGIGSIQYKFKTKHLLAALCFFSTLNDRTSCNC